MIRSLKTRIAVWYITLSTAILIGFGLVVYLNLTRSLCQERKDVVTGYAERIRAFALAQSDCATACRRVSPSRPAPPSRCGNAATRSCSIVAAASVAGSVPGDAIEW